MLGVTKSCGPRADPVGGRLTIYTVSRRERRASRSGSKVQDSRLCALWEGV